MFLLPRLLHVLVITALVAVLGMAGGQPSGSGCLKASSVEMCFDPAVRVAAQNSDDQGGKKCFEAILLCGLEVGLDGACDAVLAEFSLAKPMPSPVAPWKPPRVSV